MFVLRGIAGFLLEPGDSGMLVPDRYLQRQDDGRHQ